ncbi:hypothetical protein BH11PSE10_BH11PSE10_15640 [soil metagenome]
MKSRVDVARTARAELKASSYLQQLDSIFESSRDALVAIDATGTILRINPRTEAMFGWRAAELVAQPLRMLLPAHAYDEFRALWQQALQAPARIDPSMPWPMLQALRRDGHVLPVEVGMSVATVNGRAAVTVAFGDMTEGEELAEALQQGADRYRHTLDNMLEGCQIVGNDWRYRYVNAAAAQQAGRSVSSLIGRTMMRAHPGFETTELFDMCQRCLTEGRPQQQELDAVFPGGQIGRFQMSVSATPEGLSIFSVDITEQRQAEARVKAVLEALEQRVAERTAELEEARVAADAANRAKSDFLASMSHEIRTPMNGVIGMVDVLFHGELLDHQVEAVRTIRNSAASLLGLIDDVLDFSKIEAGRLELEREEVALHELIENVCITLLPIAGDKRVDVSLFVSPLVPAKVWTDATRLRQVLLNLLGNAIKFSVGSMAHRGEVSVRAEMSGGAATALTVRIVDNGIGMSPETCAALFEPFVQAETSITRRFGGTGLGLTICRRLLDLMHGEIEVRSALGHGTTFTVTVPLEPVQGDDSAGPMHLGGVTCIVVGADAWGADMGAYLEHAQAQVILAADLAAAAALARPPGRTVVVHRAVGLASSLHALRASFPPSSGVGLVLVDPTGRFAPRLSVEDMVLTVGGVLLRRSSLVLAVAVASGLSPATDLTNEAAQRLNTSAPRLSVEDACLQCRLLLIAEDDEVNQLVILRQAEMLGYAAEIAADGAQALSMWQTGRYALLLTDLHMPVVDGYTLTRTIRAMEAARPDARRTPILALTANALSGEAARAVTAGMDDYLTKPLRLHTLRAALARWLP